MKRRPYLWLVTVLPALFLVLAIFVVVLGVRAGFQRPYRKVAEDSGLPSALVYSVMKAESGFREDVVSRAGAVGIMQLKPSTAEFICGKEGITFEPDRLKNGEYNTRLGCAYLKYLCARFTTLDTAICAYNAGEGNVAQWLGDERYSLDGETLIKIPFPETAAYLKKVQKFRKIYEILYR